MVISRLASALRHNVVSGVQGYHSNMSMNLSQLEDEIVETRIQIIKEYSLKGLLPVKDLLLRLNCINVDCGNLENCPCATNIQRTKVPHFEIPQIITDFNNKSIQYLGSIDGMNPFIYYTTTNQLLQHKYKKRNKNKPYVWINMAPNSNNLLDCYIFNAPLIQKVSISAIFKDPRQLELFGCCDSLADDNYNTIDMEIITRLTKQKIYYYRQLADPVSPNNQTYHAG